MRAGGRVHLTRVARATALILGALAFKHLVDTEALPPASQRGVPQTMEQNKYLFSTTRIPGTVQDSVRGPYGKDWEGLRGAVSAVVGRM